MSFDTDEQIRQMLADPQARARFELEAGLFSESTMPTCTRLALLWRT